MFEKQDPEGPFEFGGINDISDIDEFFANEIGEFNDNDFDDSGIHGDRTLGDGETAPSLPIILLSAASAIGCGITALYITYRLFVLEIALSAGIATFCASIALGLTGAGLSALSGSRAAVGNIAFSCGLIVISLLFLGICTLLGAVTALLLAMLSG